MIKRRYTYSQDQITAIKVDGYNVWIACNDTSTNCKLLKVDAINPSNIYYEIDVTASQINALALQSTTYIVLALSSTSYIGERISRTNPLISYGYFSKPGGVNENAIDCLFDSNYYYFLTPGSVSGEIPKILKYNTALNLSETIDIETSGETIQNVKSFTIDGNGNFWLVTNTDPIRLIKVSKPGAVWVIEAWDIVP